MGTIVVITVYLINLFNSFFQKHKSKIITLLLWVLMLLLFCEYRTPIHAGIYRLGDGYYYKKAFDYFANSNLTEAVNKSEYEIGFTLLMFFFAKTKISYNAFTAVVFIMGSVLYYRGIKKVTNNFSYFLLLYFTYYFFYDTNQIRCFLAYSIIIFSFEYLYEKNLIKYILSIAIASTIHISSAFFIIYILADGRIFNKIKNIILRLSVSFTILLAGLNIIGINVIKIIAQRLQSGIYINDSFNAARPFIEIFFYLVLTLTVKKICYTNNDPKAQMIYNINVVSSLALPLIMISMVMDRFLRPMILLNYAMYANYYDYAIIAKEGHCYIDENALHFWTVFLSVIFMAVTFSYRLIPQVLDSNRFIEWLNLLTI